MTASLGRRVSRRGFISTAAAAALGTAASRGGASERPNVLIVFPDQWRRQALSCNGDPVVRTPNLDRLAAEGVNFQRCYTNNPVCSPARATILTSRYPHQTGMVQNNVLLGLSEKTLAQSLRSAGYDTGYIGKWHLDGPPRPGFVEPGPHRRGYDSFEGFNRGHWYHDAQYFSNDGELIKPDVFESFYQTDLAIQFMKRRRSKPFYLFLAWGPPHTPYQPPEEFDRFTATDLEWRPNVPEALRGDERTPRELCGYYGLCETLDHEMGRMLKFLDESGVAENTLVLFTADHGDCHGSHGLYRKGHAEEESVGIPLIARLPGVIARGARPNTVISLIDVMPSLLALCGVEAPPTMEGRDLSAAFRGETVSDAPIYIEGRMTRLHLPKANENVTGERYGAWRAIVTREHKLAISFDGEVRLVTDLEKDPYELENLAHRAEASALQRDLLASLREIGRRTGDPFPEPVAAAATGSEE